MSKALRSQWGSLNEQLIAKLYPVEHHYTGNGDYWAVIDGSDSVEGPICDCNLETALQWHSPFEAIGAESKLPLLTGLLQSGGLQSALSALASFAPDGSAGTIKSFSASLDLQTVSDRLRDFEGLSGMTRLNSTQIFSGMQPMKFTMTMIFRAWADPKSEVTEPVNQLMQWALPQELSKAGFIESFSKTHNLIRSLFPSKAPQILGFSYGGASVLPVVIESIGQPITVPRDSTGARLHVALQLNVSTLAAIDAAGWRDYGIR
ncbi:MAG: hypothetical protein ISP90_02900 [Nevskia sp.]|nr:hypothetical protein [Nevskia sp.]